MKTEVKQHRKPCKECPFRRRAMRGWLGVGGTVQTFLSMAHSNVIYDCHSNAPAQCVGMAVYRANVAKEAIPPMLEKEPDNKTVFATPAEFNEHHGCGKPMPSILPFALLDAGLRSQESRAQ